MIKVRLTESQNNEINGNIEKFVNEMLLAEQSVSYYNKKRNAVNAKENIFLGKKAEYLTLLGLHLHYGFPLVEIDLEIRNNKHKRWEKDLPFSKKGMFPDVHVKGCNRFTLDYCGDFSWTFQVGNNDGSYGKDDIFDDADQDLVSLVYMEDKRDREGVIKALLPFSVIKKHLKNPKKANLVGLKKCLYYEDVASKPYVERFLFLKASAK